jgi:TATA-box binding protein (TBP) (component of TFIID and TFIIIB)
MVSNFNELVKSSAMVAGNFSKEFDLYCLFEYLPIEGDIVHITFEKKKRTISGVEPHKTFKSGVCIKMKNGCNIKIFSSGAFSISGCGSMDIAMSVGKTTLEKLLKIIKEINYKKQITLGKFGEFYTLYNKKILTKIGEIYTFENFVKNKKVFINNKECIPFHLMNGVYIQKNHLDKVKKLYNNLAIEIGQVEYLMNRKSKSLCIKDCKYIVKQENQMEYDITKNNFKIGVLKITVTTDPALVKIDEKTELNFQVCDPSTEIGELRFSNSNCHTSYIIPKGAFINRQLISDYLKSKDINCVYDPCSYPGVKFSYGSSKVTIFRTGSIIFSSKVDVNIEVFPFIKKMFSEIDMVSHVRQSVPQPEETNEEEEIELSIWDI